MALETAEHAARAGLVYVNDASSGIRRVGRAPRFRYVDGGRPVRSPSTLARIRKLVIPPAWKDVWICKSPRGHIQAMGYDAKGRKQYLYHPRWREIRDQNKYERMIAFGRALPRMRDAIERDLKLPGMQRRKVLAAVTRLLELTHVRVGNEEYARKNKSFGLTTLRNGHVDVDGSDIVFRFRGKSGKPHVIGLHDRRLAKIVRRCEELPGQHLFEYLDADGKAHPVESSDVNAYIREISGGEFSAKDFRTLAGTVLAARMLRERVRAEGPGLNKTLNEVVREVAAHLGNTATICRKCYIHPAVLDAFAGARLGKVKDLAAEERAVMRLLKVA